MSSEAYDIANEHNYGMGKYVSVGPPVKPVQEIRGDARLKVTMLL